MPDQTNQQQGSTDEKQASLNISKSNGNAPGIFDIGFTRFISNTWISIIWVILIIAHFIGGVMFMSVAWSRDDGSLFLTVLVAVPISLLLCRMILEVIVIFFRIESNMREIKELLAKK